MPMGSACIGNPTISIHTALAGCDAVLGHSNVNTTMISIHTALAGCDGLPYFVDLWGETISIHTALAGCDISGPAGFSGGPGFQSTQPSQAVTDIRLEALTMEGISIHTALAGCDDILKRDPIGIEISIHTALAGCDRCTRCSEKTDVNFNPHSPRRL